ncbi:hypothetical protein CORC01_01584 [Colletotrichum orchidophilum]|uniref:Uncharacterized protein n=1 Tax=Colletotrichum orchidophilum TaxID=1209926 RepID=A0A1G4BP09_9PEZI|nr:uncharacterized protein CORC01_01584 [Colletotrichum orchidophilum]OHF03200.1 hypothetical protein CORC01_01584 [Colletotrichum orchidophilum]
MHMASKRALDGFYVIDQRAGSSWGCSEEKIAALKGAVADAQTLASKASTALAIRGSESSDAYIFWFGKENARAATKKSIKKYNYDPVRHLFKRPGSYNRVDNLTMDNLSPTGLTYMCGAADSQTCAGTVAVATHQDGAKGLSGNAIILCDRFFEYKSLEYMLQTWRDKRRFSLSAGFTLLHGLQHLPAIVGDARRCVDVPNHNRTGGCYQPECCAKLKSADKIRNAQNMAFFALEIMADPQHGEPHGRSCTIKKGDTGNIWLGGPEDVTAPVVPIVPPGGGGDGGGGKGGHPSKPADSDPPKPSGPSSPPTSPPTRSHNSSVPITRCSSRPPLSVPRGGGGPFDRDGFPQAVYDEIAAAARGNSNSTTSPLVVVTHPPAVPKPDPTVEITTIKVTPSATPTAPAINPIACYNFDVNAYGFCCPPVGGTCGDGVGTCYFDGPGISGGATNVVPNGARCPPPKGAVYCLGACQV